MMRATATCSFVLSSLIDTIFSFSLRSQVSAVYNKAIATTDTEMIANSVIVLFVMEMDEWIFSDLEAINEKWTSRNDSSSDIETGNGSTVNELNEEIALHKAQIAAQQEELGMLRESMENILRRVNIIESMC
jgi:molecular chaperone GrpE (heat shock protein)